MLYAYYDTGLFFWAQRSSLCKFAQDNVFLGETIDMALLNRGAPRSLGQVFRFTSAVACVSVGIPLRLQPLRPLLQLGRVYVSFF